MDGGSLQVLERSGERGRNRTFNLLIKSQLLCQLSYAPTTNGKVRWAQILIIASVCAVLCAHEAELCSATLAENATAQLNLNAT